MQHAIAFVSSKDILHCTLLIGGHRWWNNAAPAALTYCRTHGHEPTCLLFNQSVTTLAFTVVCYEIMLYPAEHIVCTVFYQHQA